MLKKISAFILIIAICITCCSCGGDRKVSKVKDDKAENGGTLSIFSYKPDTFCPIASSNEANIRMLGVIYDGLISLNDEYIATPCLAERWSVSGDGTLWTVTLRNNVLWHDGSEFSAKDVVYTVNQIKKLDKSPYFYNVSNIETAQESNSKTVEFKLSTPNSNFINLLYFPIIKIGADEIDAVNFKPIGTGPYKFEDRNEGNIYYLVRNSAWWGGKAKTETIQVKMLPGGDTALYAFGSGSIDLTPADNMDWGKYVDPEASLYTTVKTPVYNFLGINHKNPQLAMSELRRAISFVIDREELTEETRMGYAVSANSPVRPEWFVCKNQKFDHKVNTEAAKKLLEENGWVFRDNIYKKTADGVVYNAAFTILINEENTVRENIARIILKNLEEFGIRATIVRVPYEEYTKRISEGNYDAFIGSVVLSPDLDFSAMLGSGNMFAFEDEEMQFVMEGLKKQQTADGIKASYAEFINLFEQINPIIGLFFEDTVMIYSRQIEGDVKPSYFDIYKGIESLQKGEAK